MFKKILIAHDGTELADKAFDYGVNLAETYQAELTVMSVVEESIVPYFSFTPFGGGVPVYPTNLKETLFKRRKMMLLEDIEEVKKECPNLIVSAKIVEGHPAEKIIEVAETEKFDLIVMGSTGVHGLKRLIFGSVSDTVQIESTIPVLIIK